LRHLGFTVDLGFAGNLGRRMKRANKVNARAAVMIGDDELAAGTATVRDLDSGEQATAQLADLALQLEKYKT
jgi:histidyl-tRNA synthetase